MGDISKIDLEGAIGSLKKNYVDSVRSTETDHELQNKLLESSLDVLYGFSRGKLWGEGGGSAVNIGPDKYFPQGAIIGFFPVPLHAAEVEEDTLHKIGIFTFSESSGSVKLIATLGVECDLTNNGHENISGASRIFNYPGEIITTDVLVQKASLIALGATKDMTLPKGK